ncbi:MAG: VWA domain-containing protein [Pyrinomonadaceae bacterium]|nr:VWA domain-containing protein [Pyrinomonadaceae bacterium]
MKKYRIILPLVAFLFVIAGFSTFAQTPTVDSINKKTNRRPPQTAETPPENADDISAVEDPDVLKIETEIVTTTIKAVNRKGKFITGLTKDDFSVFDNDVEQEIAFFSDEAQPFTVALVLDMSYSSTFKIGEIQSAAVEFINQLKENDRVMVVMFDGEVSVLSEPTNDRKKLTAAIYRARLGSGTSVYDAIDLVLNRELKRVKGRKAIVLFSDGVDTTSRNALKQTNIYDATEADVVIFPIQYDTFSEVQRIKNQPVIVSPIPSPVPSRTGIPMPAPLPGVANEAGTSPEDYKTADEYLNDLAYRTNGKLYLAQSTSKLANAFADIAEELRTYYSLGFYPSERGKPGDRHKLKIRSKRDSVSVRARDNYVVPK